MSTNPGVLRLAPHNPEAEEAAIGSVLIDPDVVFSLASFLKPEHFHINRLSIVWEAVLALAKNRKAIDVVTVSDQIRAMGKADQFDDKTRGFLVNLINRTPTHLNAQTYARLVESLGIRRQLLTAGDEIKSLAYDESIPVTRIVTDSQRRLNKVANGSVNDDDLSFYDAVLHVVNQIEARMANPHIPIGIQTGLREYDHLISTLQKGLLYIVAGRPGMGKTAFLLTMILNAAKLDKAVALFSQEMTRDQVIYRLLAMETGISTTQLRDGDLNEEEYARFVATFPALAQLPIYVTNAKRTTPATILTKCQTWQGMTGLDAVFIDYLQILSDGGAFKAGQKVEKISYFAEESKQIARDLNVPVIAAAQLNRDLEKRGDKRPILSDLKDSGSIEQEADVVTFLYRDVVYNEATEFPNKAELIVAKQRDGATGMVDLHYEKSITKFTDMRTMRIDLGTL